MLDLPPELWIATLDKLRRPSPSWTNAFPDPCDIPTLKALILTSHFFHSLAEPFLYERFRIQGRRDELLAKVDRRTRHPLWVKYVIMVNCGTKVTRYLFSIFPQLRALRGVSLRSVTIEARWNTEILLLPVLEIWESDAIQIKGDLQASMIVPENLRLKHVGLGMKYISVKEAEALARLALSDQLESLKLIRDESAVLRTLNAEAGFSSFHQLRSFEGVIPPDFDLLYNFLRHCPEITSVHITKEIEKRVTLPPAPPDILPRLQSFKGPPRAARLFIQSRPIEHIALLLDMQQRPEDAVFNSLNTASAPIKSLYLATWYMISKTTLASLAAAFPALESLVIDFMVDMEPRPEPWEIEDLVPLSQLNTLRFTSESIKPLELFKNGDDLDVQAEIVNRLGARHPAIELIELSGQTKWVKDGSKREWTSRGEIFEFSTFTPDADSILHTSDTPMT